MSLETIKGYCDARISIIAASPCYTTQGEKDKVIDELRVIMRLCDGLTKQDELLTKALNR